jgi:hypothetical protein
MRCGPVSPFQRRLLYWLTESLSHWVEGRDISSVYTVLFKMIVSTLFLQKEVTWDPITMEQEVKLLHMRVFTALFKAYGNHLMWSCSLFRKALQADPWLWDWSWRLVKVSEGLFESSKSLVHGVLFVSFQNKHHLTYGRGTEGTTMEMSSCLGYVLLALLFQVS